MHRFASYLGGSGSSKRPGFDYLYLDTGNVVRCLRVLVESLDDPTPVRVVSMPNDQLARESASRTDLKTMKPELAQAILRLPSVRIIRKTAIAQLQAIAAETSKPLATR